MESKRIEIKGVVQGVGFRPFVYKLAQNHKITGWVLNNSQGVFIHAQGEVDNLNQFIYDLTQKPPRQAVIKEMSIHEAETADFQDFTIIESQGGGEQEVLISPDIAICPDCHADVLDPHNRRYNYPFTNCTNCGPRFTIIKGVPYDRPKTTMAEFPMCSKCHEEYHNPLNRRFHAQPNACPGCGPELSLLNNEGKPADAIAYSDLLLSGCILAVKGLGGFHLVCHALDYQAVNKLRNSKKRESKPFAVMAKDLGTVRRYCYLSPQEEELLQSPQAPIVILKRKPRYLPKSLAPGVNTLGVMLPYTPLHMQLFKNGVDLIVMTSGNISSNPLVYSDDDAFAQLSDIADFFLIHNRQIYNRCDDSVVKVINNSPQLYRRARGYVPLPVDIPPQPSVLACGGDLKSTFCLTKNNKAFLSQHMGDLDNYLNMEEYKITAERMQAYLDIKPQAVVVDLHPEYNSHKWGYDLDKQVFAVQHHHAHLASCLADNGIDEKVLGIICDGTGYGTDGHIWGMEFLWGDYTGFQRLAHLEYIPLPGGEAAVRHPQRMLVSYLFKHFGEQGTYDYLAKTKGIRLEEVEQVIKQIKTGVNCPLTSSCGRLFDAVSTLLGICSEVNYEGQAAIEMEENLDSGYQGAGYNFELIHSPNGPLIISTKKLWKGLLEDISQGIKKDKIAAKFHVAVAQVIIEVCLALRKEFPLQKAALSGGVMQNKFLLEQLVKVLEINNIRPLVHKQVPANDGGLSLGQALIGGRLLNVCSSSG
ncbi:MAG: carbamoyltransferase HypF [Bacillota bacterium]